MKPSTEKTQTPIVHSTSIESTLLTFSKTSNESVVVNEEHEGREGEGDSDVDVADQLLAS